MIRGPRVIYKRVKHSAMMSGYNFNGGGPPQEEKMNESAYRLTTFDHLNKDYPRRGKNISSRIIAKREQEGGKHSGI